MDNTEEFEDDASAKSYLHKAIQNYVNFVDEENTVINWIVITEESSTEHEENDSGELNVYTSKNMRFVEKRGMLDLALQKDHNRARKLGT